VLSKKLLCFHFPYCFKTLLNALMLFFFSAPMGYTSIYGELPKLKSMKEVSDIPFIPSDRPWETLFSGSSHVLPPLTKLCPTFLSSLLEKRTVANE
jgi:NET1-associated nuclear protein 1 (U3 small nucleolar RNA-associated protein 17)